MTRLALRWKDEQALLERELAVNPGRRRDVVPEVPAEFLSRKDVKEWEVTGYVLNAAATLGYTLRCHIRDSTKSDAVGWPDWVLGRLFPPRVVFLELKGSKTRITHEQRMWIWLLQKAGLDARIVTPKTIQETMDWMR